MSVIFDGTTHVCEAIVVVLRCIDDSWNIYQRVVCLMLLAKSSTGEEVAQQLITLSTDLGISSNLLLAAMRDRASVNVEIRTLNVVYPKLLDIGCFSHTLDHVGEKFNTPVLDKFAKSWINMFSKSPKCKLAWTTQTGLPVLSHSSTRWEVLRQVHDSFGDVLSFITSSTLQSCDIWTATDGVSHYYRHR